jgi:hypothetical protein
MRRIRLAATVSALLILALAVGLGMRLQRAEAARQVSQEPSYLPTEFASRLTANVISEPQPPAEMDTCQHCHLSGTISSLWYPSGRWIVFATAGLILVYGSYRMGSVWITRERWKPVPVRLIQWTDDRFQIVDPIQKVLNKPVPRFAMKWWYCLGGITFALGVILGVTGVLLSFYYQPTPESAYESIQYIETQVRFGAAIRAIHHWASNGIIVMVVAHMLRVFISGAFKPPRELTWVSGVVLLVMTLAFGFTGYLLPWDQTAFWASTVGSEIAGAQPAIGNLALIFLRGGWDVSGITLSRFFGLHVMVLPIAALAFLGGHFIMIRRQGVAEPL